MTRFKDFDDAELAALVGLVLSAAENGCGLDEAESAVAVELHREAASREGGDFYWRRDVDGLKAWTA